MTSHHKRWLPPRAPQSLPHLPIKTIQSVLRLRQAFHVWRPSQRKNGGRRIGEEEWGLAFRLPRKGEMIASATQNILVRRTAARSGAPTLNRAESRREE